MHSLNLEQMITFMNNAPVNIFFKNMECKYTFVSGVCKLFSVEKRNRILGRTDLEIQRIPELGKMYYEDDKKILSTGEGSEYISKVPTRDRGTLYYEIKKNAVRDSQNHIVGIVGIISDVTDRIRLEKKVEELSIIDSLTRVYNRNFLSYIAKVPNVKIKFPFTVIMSDCNYLKKVNDLYGHEYGDILLRIVAKTIKEQLPKESAVVRMGGDEFMALCNNLSEEKAISLMAQIQKILKKKSKNKLPLSIAMGSYTVYHEGISIEDAYHEADRRMYENKKSTHLS